MQEKITFKNSKGDTLKGEFTLVDKLAPTIIIVHGYDTSIVKSRSTKSTADALSAKGINTFIFDLWGHGESDGNIGEMTFSEGVDDVECAIQFLNDKGLNKIGLIGTSFGGLVCLDVASRMDIYLLVLRSSIINFEEREKTRWTKQELDDWREKGFREYKTWNGSTIKQSYRLLEDSRKHDGYELAKSIKIPTLIIHGDKDESIPVSQAEKASKIIQGSKLEIVEGGDHPLTNKVHFDYAMKLIKDFVLEFSRK